LCQDLASKHKENTNLKEFLFKLVKIKQYESLYSSEIQCYRFWCRASVPRFEGFHFLILPPKSGKIIPCHQHKSVQISTSALQVLIKSVGVYLHTFQLPKKKKERKETILKFISESM